MARKPPLIERQLIAARDHRRKYGARLTFQIRRSAHIGDLENVSLLLPDGSLAIIQPDDGFDFEVEGGKSRVRHQPLQVLDLLEAATLNCHYSSVI